MKHFWRGILIIVLGISSTAYAADGTTTSIQKWVEANVPEMMREAKMPGFALAVINDGETIYAEGFGARDPKQNLPTTPDTLFGIGSITKSFVAIAILQLVEDGKLRLDDPVSKHIPLGLGLPGKPITIKHLLTHSPGFPNLGTSTVLISRGLGRDTGVPMSSAADFYRFVNGATDQIVFAPGEHFFYNNAAWRMLGHIIQEIAGMPFHEYLTRKVIRPLGMKRTTLNTKDLFEDPDHLIPHRQDSSGPVPSEFPYPNPENNPDFSFLSAAGGISSSVNEMTKYLNVLIALGQHPKGKLASRGAFEDMQTLHIKRGEGYFGDVGYGYGLTITPDFLGHKMISHGGSIRVSTANMAIVPDLKIGVIMMGNSSGMDYATITTSVLALLMGKDLEVALPFIGVRERMNQLVGNYTTYRELANLHVTNKEGVLYIGQEEPRTPLIPEDPNYRSLKFHTLREGLKSPVEFRIEENGRVVMLRGRSVYRKEN